MLLVIAAVLFVLWVAGAFVVHVGGGLIHLLAVIALILVIVRLVQGKPVI